MCEQTVGIREIESHFGAGDKALDFGITNFARDVGSLSAPRESESPDEDTGLPPGAEQARGLFVKILDRLSFEEDRASLATQLQKIKAILGLGIIAACQSDPRVQVQAMNHGLLRLLFQKDGSDDVPTIDTFLSATERPSVSGAHTASDYRYPKDIRRLALNESVYVDQYLLAESALSNAESLRAKLFDSIGTECKRDPWSPAICDYHNVFSTLRRSRQSPEQTDLNVYMVCSVKGGVGKSTVALALFETLSALHRQRTLLMDLDFSGPTLQYYLRIPDCSKRLVRFNSDETISSSEWCYPSLLDLVPWARRLNESQLRSKAADIILRVHGDDNKGVVLLPDSPTVSQMLYNRLSDPESPSDLLMPIRAVLEAAIEKQYTNVILDLPPGLIGTNGVLLNFISQFCRTQLLLVSSARASDLATSIYEGIFIAAEGEINVVKPVHYFVNMWRRTTDGGDLRRELKPWLDVWTNRCIERAIKGSMHAATNVKDATTGDYVFHWRIWSYLYWRSVSRSKDNMRIEPLPYSEELAELLSIPERADTEFFIDLTALTDQKDGWYGAFSTVMGWGERRADE